MDTDFLRLVLILAGIALILGIYFWERRKRAEQEEIFRRERDTDEEAPWEEAAAFAPVEPEADDLDRELADLGGLLATERKEPVEQMPLFSADDESGGGRHSREPSPTKIIQINIVSRDTPFPGTDILESAAEAGLKPGEMEIFHCHETSSGRRALFSMANMMEPGTFPLDAMETFSAKGLVLFCQLPGPKEGPALFEQMLSAAGTLAERLGGELQDETHSYLTRQTTEHLREQIAEFQRRLRLPKKRS